MISVRLLLYPFSVIYGGVMWLRRYAYVKGWFARKRYPVKTIGVGNLKVGGTGKTPHVEYLIKELSKEYAVATLSRGYGRKSKGVILASEQPLVSATLIGDEPMQYYQKFPNIEVVVAESRCAGMEYLLAKCPHINCVVLDDCFQHLAIQCDTYWLITEYHNLYISDYPFPAGNLREGRGAAKFADTIVVSKVPTHCTETDRERVQKKIAPISGQSLRFTTIHYGELMPVFANNPASHLTINTVILLAGIANPEPLFTYLSEKYSKVIPIYYPDHHQYIEAELAHIVKVFSQNNSEDTVLITTEKDAMRLTPFSKHPISNCPLYYLPIEVVFI